MSQVAPVRRTRRQAFGLGVLALTLAGSTLVGAAQAKHDRTGVDSLTYEPHAGLVAPPRHPGRLAPATGALMGVHSHDSHSIDAEEQGIFKLEEALGRTMDINNRYYGDIDDFSKEGEMSWLEEWDIENGRIPLVGWGCTNSDKVINGSLDKVIRETAQVMKAFGHEFFMRYCWEMDGSRKQGEVKGYKKFVAAWQRMYTLFQEEGATNVIWVWTPNAAGFKDRRSFTHNEPPAPYFYPGDDYVDWIAADGYNWGVSDRNQGDRWRHFVEIFDEFMVFARQHPKPIMIGEYGAQEQKRDPSAKPEWMKAAHETLMDKPRTEECPWCGVYSDVAAIVYFDVDYGPHGDWRIMSSPESLAAYKIGADDPWFHQIDTLPWTPRTNRQPGTGSSPQSASQPSQTQPQPAPDSAESQPSPSAEPAEPTEPQPEPQTAPEDAGTAADDGAQPDDAAAAQPADDAAAQPADDAAAQPDDDAAAQPADDAAAQPADDAAAQTDDDAKPADDDAKPADDDDAKPTRDRDRAAKSTDDDDAKADDADAKADDADASSGSTQQRPQAESRQSERRKKSEPADESRSGSTRRSKKS